MHILCANQKYVHSLFTSSIERNLMLRQKIEREGDRQRDRQRGREGERERQTDRHSKQDNEKPAKLSENRHSGQKIARSVAVSVL